MHFDYNTEKNYCAVLVFGNGRSSVVTLVEEESNTFRIHNGFISLDPDLPNGDLYECGGGEQAQVGSWKGVDVVVCLLFLSCLTPLFYFARFTCCLSLSPRRFASLKKFIWLFNQILSMYR